MPLGSVAIMQGCNNKSYDNRLCSIASGLRNIAKHIVI